MLTVEEIRNVSFRRAGRKGYMTEDVDRFVDGVIGRINELDAANRELRAKADRLAIKNAEYESQAETVRSALITAEKASKQKISEAEAEAERIIADAKKRADAIMIDAEEQSSQRLTESEIRARKILDNALIRSASGVDENNRIIEEQKQSIIQIQSEVSRFKEALIDSYTNHLKLINSLPKAEEFRQYQEKLEETYRPSQPVTSAAVEQELKDETEKDVQQIMEDGPMIKVSVLEPEKVKEIAEEVRTNSKAKEALERDHMTEVKVNEAPDSNAAEIEAAANPDASKAKKSDEPMPESIDEIGDGLIFGKDGGNESGQEDKE